MREVLNPPIPWPRYQLTDRRRTPKLRLWRFVHKAIACLPGFWRRRQALFSVLRRRGEQISPPPQKVFWKIVFWAKNSKISDCQFFDVFIFGFIYYVCLKKQYLTYVYSFVECKKFLVLKHYISCNFSNNQSGLGGGASKPKFRLRRQRWRWIEKFSHPKTWSLLGSTFLDLRRLRCNEKYIGVNHWI